MNEPRSPITFLPRDLVLEIHEAQIQEHGGASGLRDEGLLDSALAQPAAQFGGEYLHADLFEMGAAYLYHLANNHPFIDGNKRTALAACLVFLDVNGYRISEEGEELADLVLQMITEHRNKAWVAEHLRERAERHPA